MNGKSLLILSIVMIIVSGCGDDGSPVPAVCFVEPGFIDFGQVLAPLDSRDTETINRTISITNRVYTNSDRGNADLVGAFTIHGPDGGHPPVIKLLSATQDDEFLITPRQTLTYNLVAEVNSETLQGVHTGYISLGLDCGDIPFVVRVHVREEAPPELHSFFGRTGDAEGEFDYPTAIATDEHGDVYVIEDDHDRLQVFDADGNFRTAWSVLRDEDGFTISTTDFIRPSDVEVGPDGNIHLADVGWPRVFLSNRHGFHIKTWGMYQKPPSSAFQRPYSLAVDDDGYVYVLDVSAYKILKFDISQINPQVLLAEWGVEGPAPGQFGTVSDIELDSQGNLYLSDWEHNVIHKFSAEGEFITRWGARGTFIGEFDRPLGIGIDADDNIYVADSRNARIQKFDSDGNFLTAWGERGAGVRQFSIAYDVAIGPDGRIYVTDAGNDRVIVYKSL